MRSNDAEAIPTAFFSVDWLQTRTKMETARKSCAESFFQACLQNLNIIILLNIIYYILIIKLNKYLRFEKIKYLFFFNKCLYKYMSKYETCLT